MSERGRERERERERMSECCVHVLSGLHCVHTVPTNFQELKYFQFVVFSSPFASFLWKWSKKVLNVVADLS
jgi:hypothetical protein